MGTKLAQGAFEIGVGVITRRVTLQRRGGDAQRFQAKLSNTGIKLLVDLSKGDEAAALLHCRWLCIAGEIFDQRAPVVAVVVLQAEQRHDRWADIGVIRPGSPADTRLIPARPDHAKPGGNDFRLHITMIPGEARVNWAAR